MIIQREGSPQDVDNFYDQLKAANKSNWFKLSDRLACDQGYSFRVFDSKGNTLLLVIYYS